MKSLRNTRQEQNISQEKLAELTGIPAPNISAFEHNRHTPNQETRNRIEAILGKVDWIAGMKEIKSKRKTYFEIEQLLVKIIFGMKYLKEEEKQIIKELCINHLFNL